MTINIIEQIIPTTNANRPGGNYEKKYITIHETGNINAGAGAKNHATYLSNGANGEVGYHYTVDDKEIYHHIPDNEKAWHCGDGANGTGNLHSIGVEICVNSDGDFEKAKANTAWLAAKLMKDNGISLDNIKQHYDWSKKNCPQTIRATGMWDAFKAMCQAEYDMLTGNTAIESSDTYTVQAGDTLYAIGKKLGVNWQDIASVNGIAAPYTIYNGQELKLSGGNASITTDTTDNTSPAEVPAVSAAKYKVGDHVTFSTCYKSSTAPTSEHIAAAKMKRNHGTITKIANGAKNPYLLDGGLCWVNDGDIRGYYNG